MQGAESSQEPPSVKSAKHVDVTVQRGPVISIPPPPRERLSGEPQRPKCRSAKPSESSPLGSSIMRPLMFVTFSSPISSACSAKTYAWFAWWKARSTLSGSEPGPVAGSKSFCA